MSSLGRQIRIVLIGAFVLRACFAIAVFLTVGNLEAYHIADSWTYLKAAHSLIDQGLFFSDGSPEIFRTPGYPIFLIPGILMGYPEIFTVLTQCALSCVTVYLVFLTSQELFRNYKIALVAAILYAFEPLSNLYVAVLLTETLFTFFIMIFVYQFAVYIRTERLRTLFSGCVFLIASIYVRPASYYLPAFVALFIVFLGLVTRKNPKKLIWHSLVFTLTTLVAVGVWQVRNYLETGYYGFSSTAPYNLYFWMGSLIVAGKTGKTPDSIREKWGEFSPEQYFAEHNDQREWPESKILNWQQRQAIIYIKENWYHYFLLVFKGAGYNLLGSGFDTYRYLLRCETNLFRPPKESGRELDLGGSMFAQAIRWMRSLPTVLLIIQFVFLFLLATTYAMAIPGFIHGFKTNFALTCFMMLTVAYFILVSAAIGLWSSRYRMPAMPIICVFAGYGATATKDHFAKLIRIQDN